MKNDTKIQADADRRRRQFMRDVRISAHDLLQQAMDKLETLDRMEGRKGQAAVCLRKVRGAIHWIA